MKCKCRYKGCKTQIEISNVFRRYCEEHSLLKRKENYQKQNERRRLIRYSKKKPCPVCGKSLPFGRKKYCSIQCVYEIDKKRWRIYNFKKSIKKHAEKIAYFEKRIMEMQLQ